MNSKNKLEKIYNIYILILMGLPVIPEILGYGFYSLKQTLFVISTVVVSGIILFLKIKEKHFNMTILDILSCTYLLFVILATIFAKHGRINAILGTNGRGEGTILILTYIVTFVLFSKGYKYIKQSLKIGMISAGVVSIYSIIEVILPESYASPFMFRNINGIAYSLSQIKNIAITTMVNQNFLSSYICMFLPSVVFNYINSGNKWGLGLIILLFLAQVFSLSLGGYITFILMYLVIIIYSLIVNKDKKVLTRVLLLTSVMIALFVLVNHINNGIYMGELGGTTKEIHNLVDKNDDFGTGRLNIWKTCFMIINKYKLFGIGPDSLKYEIYKPEYKFVCEELIDKAHSEPLQIAVTTGIPAVITYLVIIAVILIGLLKIVTSSLKNSNDNFKDEKVINIHMIFISIISYVIQSMMNISVIQVAPVFWAILGLGASVIKHEKGLLIINKK